MSDEFIIEEEESSSPFLMIAAALAGILILALLCIGTVLTIGGDEDPAESPAFLTRVAENLNIAATNTAVVQTVSAAETLAAIPTNTLVPTNTPAPSPTATATASPTPTDTPVVQPPDEEPTATLDLSGLPGGGLVTATPFPGTGTDGSATGNGTLPETGLSAWGAMALALFFLGSVIVVRRLRSS